MKQTGKRIRSLALIFALIFALASGVALAEPGGSDAAGYAIPDNEAMAFLARMGTGWNLGNTFDATREGGGDEMTIERYWCGVFTTREMIEAVRQAGFSTLRVPVSWHNHVDDDFAISAAWLDRVQQIVDWGLEQGMTVILNTHHDIDPAYCYPSSEHMETSLRYIERVWTQLAERFSDYGDQLIFESMNEPRLKDTPYEWQLNLNEADCRDAAACVNELNQRFVDTVRAAGGGNADRYLMVPAYDASADNALSDAFALPQDPADNRIIVSVHAYTPYSFALQDGGTSRFSAVNRAQTGEIDRFMDGLDQRYIANGIPVVLGEFGARDKDGNLQARVDYTAYYVSAARARGIPCCWWDNNSFVGSGENFGLLRRADCAWRYPEIVQALTGVDPTAG